MQNVAMRYASSAVPLLHLAMPACECDVLVKLMYGLCMGHIAHDANTYTTSATKDNPTTSISSQAN